MEPPQKCRQVLILTGLYICSIADGYLFGQMSGMLAALQSRVDNLPLTDEDISWIVSTMSFTIIFCCPLAACVTDKLGRPRALTILTAPILANWITLYFAQDMTLFIISRVLGGISFVGISMLMFISMGEYTSARNRGICLSGLLVGIAVGGMIGHVVGIFFHWRTCALIGLGPALLTGLLPLLWVESPSWLASKGKFDECEKSFRALHGYSASNDRELEILIKVEKDKLNILSKQASSSLKTTKILIAVKQRYFWNLFSLTFVLNIYRTAAGRFLFSAYLMPILENISSSSNMILFTLLVDIFGIIGLCLSFPLTSKFNIKTVLIYTGLVGNLFLLALSVSLYFVPKSLYSAWINSSLLALYFVIMNAGPFPTVDSFCAGSEIFPLEIKAYCMFIFSTMTGSFMFLSVKLAGSMIASMGYHGLFFFNSILVTFCLMYIWKRLPETKGKTLQEIEYFFKNNTFVGWNDFLKTEQNMALV